MSLPHAYPFRLVEPTAAGARLLLTANAYWLRGNATFDAVWLVEAAAQAAALLPRPERGAGERLHLAGVDDCRLERLPRPGETIEFEVREEGRLGGMVRVAVTLACDGQRVGELRLTLAAAS